MLLVVVVTDSPNTQHLRHIRSTTQTAESRQADEQSLLRVWSSVWPSAFYELLAVKTLCRGEGARRILHIIACLLLSAMWLNRWVFCSSYTDICRRGACLYKAYEYAKAYSSQVTLVSSVPTYIDC